MLQIMLDNHRLIPGQFNLTTYFSIHPIFIRRAFTVLCEHPKAFATARNDFVFLYSANTASSVKLSFFAGGLIHLRISANKSCSLWRLSESWICKFSFFFFSISSSYCVSLKSPCAFIISIIASFLTLLLDNKTSTILSISLVQSALRILLYASVSTE